MRDEVRAEVLKLLGELKREVSGSKPHPLDNLAIDLISDPCEPLKMASGLQSWLGVKYNAPIEGL